MRLMAMGIARMGIKMVMNHNPMAISDGVKPRLE